MSCKELIESLRKAADARLKVMWEEAEAEAGRIRAEFDGRLKQLRDEAERRQQALCRTRTAQALSEANSRARSVMLSAEKDLSDEMFCLAVSMLPSLRAASYEAYFAQMIRELPVLAWETVLVNPTDVPLASKFFPEAKITPDPGISGGMEVSARGGAIRIVNTLEKRLERAWAEMQSGLIRDVYEEVDHEAAAGAGGPGIPGRIPADEDQRQTVALDR